MYRFQLIVFTTLLHSTVPANGAKILFFVSGMSSYSHRGSMQPLANKLASRNHDVTFLSPYDYRKFPYYNPAIKEICPDGVRELNEEIIELLGVSALKTRIEKKFSNDVMDQVAQFFGRGQKMCSVILNSRNFKEWLSKAGQYDLVVIDNALNECAYGVAHYLKAKTILFTTFASVMLWDVQLFGLPPELSWVPGLESAFEGEMGFWDRLLNAIGIFSMSWSYSSHHLPAVDKITRESLGLEEMKGMESLEKFIRDETSLILVNSHYSDTFPRNYAPFVVQVGGMTMDEVVENKKEPKELPADIAKFIQDGGKNGFIYISFGSLVKFSTAPPSLVQAFMGAIRDSPNIQFLWKWEGEIPKTGLKNVLFKPWFPQLDILVHPKIRGFVTQGGQVSMQQAIWLHVPLIIFSVMGDQNYNGKRAHKAGNGIEMELAGLTSTDLQNAFQKIMNDPTYATKAKELSQASRDRPMSGLDTAVWWTEYVLRTNNTSFLRPDNMYQPLWLQWSMDILFFVFFVLLILAIVILVIVRVLVKLIFKMVRNNSPNKVKRS